MIEELDVNRENVLPPEELETICFDKMATLKRIAVNRFGKNDSIYGYLYMYPITKEEVDMITRIKKECLRDPTKGSRITLEDGVVIGLENIKCYGDIDYDNPTDRQVIKDLLSKDIYECRRIPRGFDYETNTSVSKGKFIQWTETTDYIKAFKYYLSRIGKPEHILIIKLGKNGIL